MFDQIRLITEEVLFLSVFLLNNSVSRTLIPCLTLDPPVKILSWPYRSAVIAENLYLFINYMLKKSTNHYFIITILDLDFIKHD